MNGGHEELMIGNDELNGNNDEEGSAVVVAEINETNPIGEDHLKQKHAIETPTEKDVEWNYDDSYIIFIPYDFWEFFSWEFSPVFVDSNA